jgi:thiamine biosynthesis protein ThiS
LKPDKKIEIVVNGLVEAVPEGSNLTDLIALFNEDDVHLIVELNGRFIYPEDYNHQRVKEGDGLEFIHPNIGG